MKTTILESPGRLVYTSILAFSFITTLLSYIQYKQCKCDTTSSLQIKVVFLSVFTLLQIALVLLQKTPLAFALCTAAASAFVILAMSTTHEIYTKTQCECEKAHLSMLHAAFLLTALLYTMIGFIMLLILIGLASWL